MNTRPLVCCLAALGLLILIHKIQAQEPQQNQDSVKVLILSFDNATGQKSYDAASKTVGDLMAAFLVSGTDRISIVDRKALESIYQEKSLTWQGFVADRSALAKTFLSQANYIVRGSLIQTKKGRGKTDTFEIHAFLHETETTRLLDTFESRGTSDQLVNLCRDIASGIAVYFQEDLPPIEPLPLDDDPKKSLLMIHGLGAFYNGQVDVAMVCFLKILDRHGNDEAAKFWLAKSFLTAGLDRHAKIELEDFLSKFPVSDRIDEARQLLKPLKTP